ncbi:MAG TPA: hypothetical protein V6C86_04120 [Oculatellaceae cyanobacterium]
MQTNVAALKEQFEQLFPGKWLLEESKQRHLQTGITGIDAGHSKGIARKRISEWVGAASSGKSTLLRTVVANWCAAGMHIVYIDTTNKLVPADWAFVEQGISGSKPSNTVPSMHRHSPRLTLFETNKSNGRFWVVRNLMKGHKQDALWAAEQLVRSNIFDVVIFDATESLPLTSRFYARLQRSLDSSKAALLIIKDTESTVLGSKANTPSSWGCHARFNFGWSTEISQSSTLYGLNGLAALVPAISSSTWKDGITNKHEITFSAYAKNSLFTYPQVPDRRVPKARASFKK